MLTRVSHCCTDWSGFRNRIGLTGPSVRYKEFLRIMQLCVWFKSLYSIDWHLHFIYASVTHALSGHIEALKLSSAQSSRPLKVSCENVKGKQLCNYTCKYTMKCFFLKYFSELMIIVQNASIPSNH